MSLLDANADSLQASALNSFTVPAPVGPPEPGIFKNAVSGAGRYFMRGMAEAGRAVSMAGAAVPVLLDKVVGSDNMSGQSLADRYFKAHDDIFGQAVDYWTPKPNEVGAAGQVVGSLAAGLTQFMASPALLVGTSMLSTSEDLVRQGVDPGAALVAGDVAGLATVGGIATPIFGKTLAGRMAAGVAGNLATNVPQAAITRGVLQTSGAPAGVAEQFDPWDVRARTVDALMGMAFGAKAHVDARAEAKADAFRSGPIPSERTPIADAAGRAVDGYPMTATQRDAIMVMNAARHLEEAALPWRVASESAHTQAVDNLRTAVGQMAAGRAVDVPAIDAPPGEHVDPARIEVADAIAADLPPSGKPIPAPEMRMTDVRQAMDMARRLSDSIAATGADGQARSRLLQSEAQRLRATASQAPTPDIARRAELAAAMLEQSGPFPDTLRLPTAEFDPATGQPLTISANEHVAQAMAEAEHVKSTASGFLETAATCLLGGV